MQNKNNLLTTTLIILCAFFIFLALASLKNIRKMEVEFNQQKTVLLKENIDLKTQVDSIQNIVNQKIEAVDAMEREKKDLENQLITFKDEKEKFAASFNKQVETLKRKNITLRKRIIVLENDDLTHSIRQAIEKESDESIKLVLGDMLSKIELIKEGKPVNLRPIAIKRNYTPSQVETTYGQQGQENGPSRLSGEGKEGVILSLDRKNNLVVISFGRKDGVKEGDQCMIFSKGKELARAEIIAARYRIAAAFISSIQYKYNISSIKEGDKVTMIEK